jgi:hypothetical protein
LKIWHKIRYISKYFHPMNQLNCRKLINLNFVNYCRQKIEKYVEPVKWSFACQLVKYWAPSAFRRFSEIFTKILRSKIYNLLFSVVPKSNAELWIGKSINMYRGKIKNLSWDPKKFAPFARPAPRERGLLIKFLPWPTDT